MISKNKNQEKVGDLEKVTGKIIQKKERAKTFMKNEFTCYTVSGDNGNVLCAFEKFYEDSPKEGDLVEFHLNDEILAIDYWINRKETEDGYFEFEKGEERYREIMKYRILKEF